MRQANSHLLFALTVLLLAASPVWALLTGINFDVHMDIDPSGRTIADDFHIEGKVRSGPVGGNWSEPPNFVLSINDLFPNFVISPFTPVLGDPDQNLFSFQADWSGAGYKFCDVAHLGLVFNVKCHNLIIEIVGWWTKGDKRLQDGLNEGTVLIPSFDVRDEERPQRIQIRNDSGANRALSPGVDGHIAQMDVLALTDADMGQLGADSPLDLFKKLNAKDPDQPKWPWIQVLGLGNGQFQVDSFFDVFFDITLTDVPHPETEVHIEPGGFLLARELTVFTNNSGQTERRWTWELHEAHDIPQRELDFGDAPEKWDDATGTLIGYPTTLAANGARHFILANAPWFGPDDDQPDPETDGQPHPQALGDDIIDTNDDEDGVQIPPVLIHGVAANIVIQVNGPGGYVDGWIDYNGNRIWEAAEQIISGWQAAGTVTQTVTAPAGSVVGPTFARFRINSAGDIGPRGLAEDGEVEDYLVTLRRGPVEIDVLPDASMDVTLTTADGSTEVVSLTGPVEIHVFFEGKEQGDAEDDDNDGKDDVETELVALSLSGQSSMGPVHVHLDPKRPSLGEMEETLNATSGRLDVAPFATSQGDQFAVDSFFDITFEITIETPLGPQVLVNPDPLRLHGVITHKPPGECDDYTSTNSVELIDANTGQPVGISITTAVLKPWPCRQDWGDAPDFPGTIMAYPTLAPDGARHRIVENIFLGNTTITDLTILRIDAENNGQPTMASDGDDVLDGNDDEDGIRFLTWPLRPGRPAKILVRASVTGYLSAWIDFGADGGWTEAGDYLALDGGVPGPILIPAGPSVHVFNVPASAKPNTKTYSRFRFATYPITTFKGPAKNGEVEDYLVKIRSHPGIKWIQRPDETKLGIDIRVDNSDGIRRVLADDFECTSYGYITDVHLWGSWKYDDKGEITNIHLSIHSDDPASTEPGDTFSKPAELLWEGDFGPREFREKLYTKVKDGEFWWDPYRNEWLAPGDHEIWRVDIRIHPKKAFLQEGSPKEPIVYWLDVTVKTEGGEFGWKTRRWPRHYNDDAVRNLLDADGNQIGWQDLHYPDGHPLNEENPDQPPSIDMAFVLTTDNAVTGSADLNGDHVVDLKDLSIQAAEYEPGVLRFPD